MHTYPYNDALRRMSYDSKRSVTTVCLKADDKIKKALVRIGFAFLPHIVGRRFVKVQSTHRDFGYLILL